MAVFTPGSPIETPDAVIPVDGLAPGPHTFQLIVVDEAGNESLPAFAQVAVKAPDVLVDPRPITVQKIAAPADADHDPFGKELWVTGNGPPNAAAATAFAFAISLPSGRIAGNIPVTPQAGDIAVSRNADRRVGLIAHPTARLATLISLSQRSVLHLFQLKDQPDGVAVSEDGTRGVVAIPATGQAIILDLQEFRVLAEIQVGRLPSKIILAQTSKLALVDCQGEGTLVGIDMKKLAIVGRFNVGGGAESEPMQFTATPAGFPLWTANRSAASASNALTASRINNIPLGFKPEAVAADENAKRAFLAGPDLDQLAFLDLEGAKADFLAMPAPGGHYKSVAVTRDGKFVAATHPLKASASFYLGAEPRLRSILKDLKAPSRVILTDGDEFFCILDPQGDTVSLVATANLS